MHKWEEQYIFDTRALARVGGYQRLAEVLDSVLSKAKHESTYRTSRNRTRSTWTFFTVWIRDSRCLCQAVIACPPCVYCFPATVIPGHQKAKYCSWTTKSNEGNKIIKSICAGGFVRPEVRHSCPSAHLCNKLSSWLVVSPILRKL